MDTPLYEKIFLELLEQIRSGILKPNDRVPSEKELADQYQVSRITSKKSLEKLAQLGVIERIRGKGSYVSDSLPDLTKLEQPGTQSQSLETEKNPNGLIGVIIPDFFSDCYGREILRSIEKRCSEMKYHIVIKLTYGSQEEEELAIRSLVQQGVKGLIIYPVNGQHYTASLLRLVLDQFPLVLIDRYLKGIPACSVYTDNKAAAQELTTFLLVQGHQHIAFVSPPEEYTSSIEERIQGFTTAHSHRGFAVNPNYVITELFSTLPSFKQSDESVEDQITLKTFIQENPQITAFVACEYEIAVVLVQVLQSLGKKNLDDYAITCFDHPEHPYNDWIITHIQQNERLIGLKAVDLLIDQLKGKPVPSQNIIGFRLVEGNTTRQMTRSNR
ncbi:GntR family transcriptional regulator [Fodinisporobacter ferrooxydans]|uniref:GntR family transcriptional regulator n=1 Tax=Fodinisporobacter ferrooxydans TaxID=2901836 RepID=A0ABY4CGZ1_9BACL|nr:GntR family transcriptional regulator [Alicyclobacillaceae bacterium MYW30-H2]